MASPVEVAAGGGEQEVVVVVDDVCGIVGEEVGRTTEDSPVSFMRAVVAVAADKVVMGSTEMEMRPIGFACNVVM